MRIPRLQRRWPQGEYYVRTLRDGKMDTNRSFPAEEVAKWVSYHVTSSGHGLLLRTDSDRPLMGWRGNANPFRHLRVRPEQACRAQTFCGACPVPEYCLFRRTGCDAAPDEKPAHALKPFDAAGLGGFELAFKAEREGRIYLPSVEQLPWLLLWIGYDFLGLLVAHHWYGCLNAKAIDFLQGVLASFAAAIITGRHPRFVVIPFNTDGSLGRFIKREFYVDDGYFDDMDDEAIVASVVDSEVLANILFNFEKLDRSDFADATLPDIWEALLLQPHWEETPPLDRLEITARLMLGLPAMMPVNMRPILKAQLAQARELWTA